MDGRENDSYGYSRPEPIVLHAVQQTTTPHTLPVHATNHGTLPIIRTLRYTTRTYTAHKTGQHRTSIGLAACAGGKSKHQEGSQAQASGRWTLGGPTCVISQQQGQGIEPTTRQVKQLVLGRRCWRRVLETPRPHTRPQRLSHPVAPASLIGSPAHMRSD